MFTNIHYDIDTIDYGGDGDDNDDHDHLHVGDHHHHQYHHYPMTIEQHNNHRYSNVSLSSSSFTHQWCRQWQWRWWWWWPDLTNHNLPQPHHPSINVILTHCNHCNKTKTTTATTTTHHHTHRDPHRHPSNILSLPHHLHTTSNYGTFFSIMLIMLISQSLIVKSLHISSNANDGESISVMINNFDHMPPIGSGNGKPIGYNPIKQYNRANFYTNYMQEKLFINLTDPSRYQKWIRPLGNCKTKTAAATTKTPTTATPNGVGGISHNQKYPLKVEMSLELYNYATVNELTSDYTFQFFLDLVWCDERLIAPPPPPAPAAASPTPEASSSSSSSENLLRWSTDASAAATDNVDGIKDQNDDDENDEDDDDDNDQEYNFVEGGNEYLERIWYPSIFVPNNEQPGSIDYDAQSSNMIRVDLSTGKVWLRKRKSLQIYCLMEYSLFPFDRQHCTVNFESNVYNVKQLILSWGEVYIDRFPRSNRRPVSFSAESSMHNDDDCCRQQQPQQQQQQQAQHPNKHRLSIRDGIFRVGRTTFTVHNRDKSTSKSTTQEQQHEQHNTATKRNVTNSYFTYNHSTFRIIGFRLLDIRLSESIITGIANVNYSQCTFDLILEREFTHYLIIIYLPTALIVIASWCNFWLEITSPPARVSLGVTTMLALVTSFKNTKAQLPTISYMNVLDVWNLVCTIFIALSLVEFTVVNYIYNSPKRHKNMQRIKRKSERYRQVQERKNSISSLTHVLRSAQQQQQQSNQRYRHQTSTTSSKNRAYMNNHHQQHTLLHQTSSITSTTTTLQQQQQRITNFINKMAMMKAAEAALDEQSLMPPISSSSSTSLLPSSRLQQPQQHPTPPPPPLSSPMSPQLPRVNQLIIGETLECIPKNSLSRIASMNSILQQQQQNHLTKFNGNKQQNDKEQERNMLMFMNDNNNNNISFDAQSLPDITRTTTMMKHSSISEFIAASSDLEKKSRCNSTSCYIGGGGGSSATTKATSTTTGTTVSNNDPTITATSNDTMITGYSSGIGSDTGSCPPTPQFTRKFTTNNAASGQGVGGQAGGVGGNGVINTPVLRRINSLNNKNGTGAGAGNNNGPMAKISRKNSIANQSMISFAGSQPSFQSRKSLLIQSSNLNRTAILELTPEQLAEKIDRACRYLFPILFILFNFIYWITVVAQVWRSHKELSAYNP